MKGSSDAGAPAALPHRASAPTNPEAIVPVPISSVPVTSTPVSSASTTAQPAAKAGDNFLPIGRPDASWAPARAPRALQLLLIARSRRAFHLLDSQLRKLSSFRVTLDWCGSSSQALERLSRARYDLLFIHPSMECSEPLSDETVTALCAAAAHASVIAFGGRQSAAFAERALSAGASDYLLENELIVPVLERVLRYNTGASRCSELHASAASRGIVVKDLPVAVYWKDSALVYRGCNEAFARLLGLDGMEGIAGRDNEALSWTSLSVCSKLREQELAVLREGSARQFSFDAVRSTTGSRIWVKARLVPLRDFSGAVTGVLGTFEDVSDQKRVESALRESEARLRLILEQVPSSVWMIDEDLRIHLCSGTWLPGKPQHPGPRMRSLFDVFGTDRGSVEPVRMIKKALSGESAQFRFSEGAMRYQVNVQPLRDHEGRNLGALAITTDITEQEHLEELLRKTIQLQMLGGNRLRIRTGAVAAAPAGPLAGVPTVRQ